MAYSLSEYFKALFRHWISLVVGVGAAILGWLSAFIDLPFENLRAVGVFILVAAVVYAQFRAFHDLRLERDALKSEWMIGRRHPYMAAPR